MKKTKLVLAIILIICTTALCFTACGNSGNSDNSSSSDNSVNTSAESTFPERTIKIIVPFAAGGSADLQTRAIADVLSKNLNTSVIVENQPGGGGAVGVNACLAEEADGYTLVTITNGPSTVTPFLSDVGYDPTTDLAPICMVNEQYNILSVSKDLGITKWEDFLAYIEKKGSASYGTSGVGAYANIKFQEVLRSIGIEDKYTIVPFDGGTAAVTACVGNQIDSVLTVPIEENPMIQSGDLVPLLLIAGAKSDLHPGVPCSADFGYPSPSDKGGTFVGFAAAAGTDPEIIKFLDNAIKEAAESDTVKEVFNNMGISVTYEDSAKFTERIASDCKSNVEALKTMGLIK